MTIQVTNNDFVLLGHGTYQGGAENFKLPDGVELYIVQPVGYTLKVSVAEALIGQTAIAAIKLRHKDSSPPDSWLPDPLGNGVLAPNLVLHDLGDEHLGNSQETFRQWGTRIIGTRNNVVTVTRDTLLSEILARDPVKAALQARVARGEKLRIFWSACANQISGAPSAGLA